MNALTPTWVKCEAKRQAHRQAYYLSAEYLVGRMVYNNLFCLGLLDDVKALLAEKGVDIAILEDIEDDAFGNGGLGRLAACFLDSAVTTNVPLTGYGLRYRYGLFKQTFVNGYQHEEPDDWSRFGDPWSIRRVDQAVVVKMKTGDVLAVPYDMPIIGYGAKNIGTLRLWQTESLHEIDFTASTTALRAGIRRQEQGGGHHQVPLPQRRPPRGQADAHQAAVCAGQCVPAGYAARLQEASRR